jgi:metal-responsive CopG/Arc/MetJ family transcriptional regulator
MFGVTEAKKRVECKLEEELVNRIDRVAGLLKSSRTDIIRSACIAYLKNNKTKAKMTRDSRHVDDHSNL